MDLPAITNRRITVWNAYQSINAFKASKEGNGHIFWFLSPKAKEVIKTLRDLGIPAASHFEAAHLTPVGKKYGKVRSPVFVSHEISEELVRLPTDVSEEAAVRISNIVNEVIK
jgi:dTDP-4-amino-4,6-dideoxygalactose transaminase